MRHRVLIGAGAIIVGLAQPAICADLPRYAPVPDGSVAPLPGPPTIQSCYRDYDMQVWWRNFWCFFGRCDNAAVPGTSVHGWGRAVDFEDGGGELTFSSAGYA